MQAQLENVSGLERRLSVTVPVAEIDAEVDTRLRNLAKTVKMHGFRPGKVPFRVVQQQYSGQVRQEVLGDTVQKSFGEAVREQNLRVAGYPKFESAGAAEGSGDFRYSATFEIYPEVTIGDVAGVEIERPALKVGDAEVDKTIDILRKQRVTYSDVERAAAKDDRVILSFRGTIDGVEFQGGSATDQAVIVGGGRMLPEFEANLPGIKAGEMRKFEVPFPADYPGKDVAGKTAVFEVTASKVSEPRLPEIDEQFAKALGVADGDVQKMRGEIQANVEREVARRIKARLKGQVMEGLLKVSTLDLPKSLVQIETERLVESARRDLASRGVDVKDMPIPQDVFDAQAKRRVSLGLVLADLVKARSLQARPEQVRAHVEEQAQSYEHPEEVVKWFYQSAERIAEIESLVIEDNVVEWVLATARVQDKAVDFDELMKG